MRHPSKNPVPGRFFSTAGLQADRSGCSVSLSPEGRMVLLCPRSADGMLPVGYTWKDGAWEVAPCYGQE